MPPSRMIRAIATALGAAAGAGAAQLGIGYGLGVFSWLPTVRGADEAAWLASLAWTVWISANSVVIGTVAADRTILAGVGISPLARRVWRVILAISAALGGLIVVGLTAVPAGSAQRADTFAPHVIVGGYAAAGVILGLVVAVIAANIIAVANNLIVTASWLWLLAAVATMDGVASTGNVRVAQLGGWQVTTYGPRFQNIYLPGAFLVLGSALLIGALVAWPPARRGARRVGVAFSGTAGPALLAGAYLLASPVLKDVKPDQLPIHPVAPFGVLAGLLGSVSVALLAGARRGRLAGRGANHDETGGIGVAKPKVAGDAV